MSYHSYHLLLWSGVGGQLLSYHSYHFCCGQGLVVSYCLIICCGQGLVVSYCLIICCGQGLVVSYCLIILIIFCCGQGLVVSYCPIMLVVYVGGLYCMSSLEGPFRGACGNEQTCHNSKKAHHRPLLCDLLQLDIPKSNKNATQAS